MSDPVISGVYCIYFESIYGRYYVGKSHNIHKRYKSHCSKLKKYNHINNKLQEAYIQCNEIPTLYIIEELVDTTDSIVSEKEIIWIDRLDAYYEGFNNSKGGEGYSGEFSVLLSKDTSNYVNLILNMYNNPLLSIKEAAILADVPYDAARDIVSGKSCCWIHKYCPVEYTKIVSDTGNRLCYKHTKEDYVNVLKLLAEGTYNMRQIADKSGISYSVVRNISCGSSHKYLKTEYPELYNNMNIRNRGNGSSKYTTN